MSLDPQRSKGYQHFSVPVLYCSGCVISYPPAKRICIFSLDRTVILSIIRYTKASEYSSQLRFSEESSSRIFLYFSSAAFRLSSEGSNSLLFSFSFRISFPICSNVRSAISFPSPAIISNWSNSCFNFFQLVFNCFRGKFIQIIGETIQQGVFKIGCHIFLTVLN